MQLAYFEKCYQKKLLCYSMLILKRHVILKTILEMCRFECLSAQMALCRI